MAETTTAALPRILLVDDDEIFLRVLQKRLRRSGFDVLTCTDPTAAVRVAIDKQVAVVLLDIHMPSLNGFEVLTRLKAEVAEIEVVMMTGLANTDAVIQSMRLGALDFLVKPCVQLDEVCAVLQRALKLRARGAQRTGLVSDEPEDGKLLVGRSPVMQELQQLVAKVARSDAPILIQGESGTGKELIARELHKQSRRCRKPWVPVNCATLPENLQESELFGYSRGAFTGAVTHKDGLFVATDGGSLFLDEIGELAAGTQTKLLRALQVRQVRPIGASAEIPVDFRLICASNVDLGQAVAGHRFRQDLYFRINVVRLQVPALRERPEDIPELAAHFVQLYARREEKPALVLRDDALRCLLGRAWPGNVRELQNTLYRAVVLAEGTEITPQHLDIAARDQAGQAPLATSALLDLPFTEAKRVLTDTFEKQYVHHALERCGGKIATAARMSQLDRTNFKRLVRRHKVAAGGGDAGDDKKS
jgi:two-component system response regulator HydG